MPVFTVDGTEIEFASGRSILEALDDAGVLMNGVDVPHYCWHPKLAVDGSCRLCQVEVEGMPKLQIACNTPAVDGMVVKTKNDRVSAARAGVMELLLINHPLDCPICDQAGECKLQDFAFEYGGTASRSREPRRALKKNVRLGPTIVFDQERCILCRRCVRFCREITNTNELAVVGRGDRSIIETYPGQPLDNAYSMNVADLCPVGALTTVDFRFAIRVWFLEDVPGVCTGCATGCNIYTSVANNKVHRYQPRRNDDVNDTWICDVGRLSYKEISAADRIESASVKGESGRLETATFEEAIHAAATRLRDLADAKGPGVIAGVASAHATNEDLFTFRRFLDALGADTAGVAVSHGTSDDFLIHAEKGANAAGARALGFGEAATVADRIRSGGVDAVICLGHDILERDLLGGTSELAELDTVIVLDTRQSALARVADVMFPVRYAAEKWGTLTNANGRVQRVRPVVEPKFEAYAEGVVLQALGSALTLDGFEIPYDVRAVSKAIGLTVPAFSGIDIDSVGDQGRPLLFADPPRKEDSEPQRNVAATEIAEPQ
jgi:NADH-quinone oxidoreductase subunit G